MTNDYKAVILPQAEKDILEIADYISGSLKNPTAARKLLREIKETVGRIKAFPYAMPVIKNDEITLGKEYRRADVGNYALIYRIVEEIKEVRIFAVFYAPSDILTRILNRI